MRNKRADDSLLLGEQTPTVIFILSLFFIYNPFFQLPEFIKIPLFFTIQLTAFALHIMQGGRILSKYALAVYIFLFFYLIALLRVNAVADAEEGYGVIKWILMGLQTIATLVIASSLAEQASIKVIRDTIIWLFLPIFIILLFNQANLHDYSQRHVFALGDFTYDSYQSSSLIVALLGIAVASKLDFNNLRDMKNKLWLLPLLPIIYFLFNNQARGEVIAFVIALLFLIVPRVSLVILPLLFLLLQAIIFAFETPFTERMRLLWEGEYGLRDVLYNDSLKMITDNIDVVLVGHGINGFQKYYNLESGYYPHNIYVEALITGGIILFALTLLIWIWPILKLVAAAILRKLSREEALSLSIMLLVAIVYFKSGTIRDPWVLAVFTIIFVQGNSTLLRHTSLARNKVDRRSENFALEARHAAVRYR